MDLRKFLSRYRAAVKILIPVFCDGFTVKIGLSVKAESPFFAGQARQRASFCFMKGWMSA